MNAFLWCDVPFARVAPPSNEAFELLGLTAPPSCFILAIDVDRLIGLDDGSLKSMISRDLAGLGAGNFVVAEAKGEPCSGSAKTYERLAGVEFLEMDTERHAGGLCTRVEREERRLELIERWPSHRVRLGACHCDPLESTSAPRVYRTKARDRQRFDIFKLQYVPTEFEDN